jgi:alkylhydroperoxidase family enzyme
MNADVRKSVILSSVPASPPRIRPGGAAEIGKLNFMLARLLGLAVGGGPPAVFTTLARHRGLFRRWLRFAAALMPGGQLPRADSELLILRVAHNCASEYEWSQHERIAVTAGLSAAEVARVRAGPAAEGWSDRQRFLLRAADELHAERTISDAVWAGLRPLLDDDELIELCMLVGHYEMLAMTLNSLRVAPDELPDRPPAVAAAAGRLQAALTGRRRSSNGGAR